MPALRQWLSNEGPIMVDYNIAVPQQQLFQAPDLMQNAMRMQQMQMQEMQMQELARKSATARNTQQLYADPNFDQFSPEGIRRLAQTGGYKAGIAAATGARQIESLQRQTKATEVGLEKTRLEIGAKEYDIAQDRLAAIPPGDAKSYAEWDRVHGPAYRANGVNIPTPEQWAQDPTGKLQSHMVSTSQSVRERAAKREEAGQFTVQMTDAGPVAINKLGQFRMATQLPSDGAPMGGGAGAPAVGGASMGGAGAPAMPGAGAAPAGFDMDRAKQAIAGIESGGRYGALGPVTNRGDRAFGKYQVMGANIPSWTKEALGRSMTPAEFLASPEAQERVFETQFGKSVAKYGNPADAASVWFSGRPLAKAGNASDVLGTTVPQYAQKFMAAYEGGANTPAMMRAPGFASSSGIPANVGLPVAPVMNALAGPQPPQQGNALAMQAAPMLQQQPVPVTTAPAQAAPAPVTYEEAQRAADQRKLAVKRAEESDKAAVKLESTEAERRQNAKQALSLVADPNIENLIKGSTAGLLQRAGAAVYEGATGRSTTGAISSGKLDMLANKLTLDLSGGKLGAGISNEDRNFLQKTIGDIANRNTGIDERLGALAQLREMLSAMSEGKPMRVVPTETEEPTPRRRGNVTSPTRALNAMDQQALAWAKANPNDPRAGAINERLGAR
jgi:hypothetical protein